MVKCIRIYLVRANYEYFPPLGWKYGRGFITADMLKSHLFAPSNDTLTLICGPPPMIQFACNPNLDQLGYTADRRHAY